MAKICLGAQFGEEGADDLGQVEKNAGAGAADEAAANEDVDALLLAEGGVVDLVAAGQFPQGLPDFLVDQGKIPKQGKEAQRP